MHKWLFSTLIAVACAMGVFLLATGLPEKPIDESKGLKPGQELLRITASDFQFDKKEYKVKAGTNYKISFSNKLGNHGVEFQGLGIELDKNTPVQEITFDKPGTYELKCSIMCGTGHNEMISVLIVE